MPTTQTHFPSRGGGKRVLLITSLQVLSVRSSLYTSFFSILQQSSLRMHLLVPSSRLKPGLQTQRKLVKVLGEQGLPKSEHLSLHVGNSVHTSLGPQRKKVPKYYKIKVLKYLFC